jgi:hypothetical protein
MSDEHSESRPIPEMQVPVARSPRYQEVYANGVRFRITPIDFTMTLGMSPDIPGAPANLVQDEVSVTFTHPFLKILTRNLVAVLTAIESELGPIKIPERNDPQQERITAMTQALRETKWVE